MIIYKLTSPSGKSYIGMTEKTLEHRVNQHVSDSKRFDNQLQRALNKYPIENWSKEVIEQCDNRTLLQERERFYIENFDTYTNGYNMTKGGDGMDPENASRLKTEWYQSEEGMKKRQQLSEQFTTNNPGVDWTGKRHTEESKKKISEANTGRKMSEESKKKRSEATKKMWEQGVYDNRPPPTPEHIQKRADARRGKPQTEKQKKAAKEARQGTYEIQFPDGHIETITNISDFAKEHGLDQGNLSATLSGRVNKHKGFKIVKKLTLLNNSNQHNVTNMM